MNISLPDFLNARLDEEALRCAKDERHWSEVPDPLFGSHRMLIEIGAKRKAIAAVLATVPAGFAVQILAPLAAPYREHLDFNPDWSPWVGEAEAPPVLTECGATAVFWPDDEACDAECVLPAGHPGATHEDKVLGEWDESELPTNVPERNRP